MQTAGRSSMTDNSVFLGRISTDIPSQPEINPEATASFASIEHLKQMIRTGVLDIENHTKIQPEIEQIFQKFTHLASCGKCAPCREGTKRMRQLLKKSWKATAQIRNWISWRSWQT